MTQRIKPCHVMIDFETQHAPPSEEIQKILESGSIAEKIDALKTLILIIMHDDNYPRMIMTIVQYCMREEDKTMKKLTMLYLEVIEKTNPDGSLKEQMVLLCNALRTDLLSPNEYVRARTLKLITRMKFREVLDTLLGPIMECVDHKLPYVRRNAIMCLYSILLTFGENFIPDAANRIESAIQTETDLGSRRNALLFLFEAEPQSALKYMNSVLIEDSEDSAFSILGSATADILQLVVLEEVKKVCKNSPLEKGKYMKTIISLANNSKSQSVLFECASTIIQLTSHPQAVKLSISTYIKLLNDQSADNNIKLIVLENISDLKKKFSNLLQEQLIDVMRCLSTPSLAIRKACITLALDLINLRNVNDIIRNLKKELIHISSSQSDQDYKNILVSAIHSCAVKFPEVTAEHGLVEVLLDCCLGPESDNTNDEISKFLQELMISYPMLRANVISKIHECFLDIESPVVYRTLLWILAEFSENPEESCNIIIKSLGDRPFIHKKERFEHFDIVNNSEEKVEKFRTIILPDGTYGTQILSNACMDNLTTNIPGLRKLITEIEEIDFYMVSVLSVSLTKLYFKIGSLPEDLRMEILLIMCSLVQLKTYPKKNSKLKAKRDIGHTENAYGIDPSNYDRILLCIQTLTNQCENSWLDIAKECFPNERTEGEDNNEDEENDNAISTQPDDLIVIKQLKGREGLVSWDFADDDEFKSLIPNLEDDTDFGVNLNRVKQLTGLGDPVYVECVVKSHQYDIILEFTVINHSTYTLQNLSLELAAHGDLKLVDRPQPCNIGPRDLIHLKANVKVNSTEAGYIFGNVTYDSPAGGNMCVLSLNEIYIDVSEYIFPATCSDSEFRNMWSKYNWENRILINASMESIKEYVNMVAKATSMKLLTPLNIMNSSDKFLVCNLYARSKFSEDALMNISVEKEEDVKIKGSIRIRTKSEGMASCLGDRLESLHKELARKH